MNLIIFIIGNLAHLAVKYADSRSTQEFAANKMELGITEGNGIFAGPNGEPIYWRFWALVAALHIVAAILYFVPEDAESWHPLYSLGVFALSAGASAIAYFTNKKLIKNARERQRNKKAIDGGIV